jgi:regulator of sigma E protease
MLEALGIFLILSFLVLIHELGHYWVARKVGIDVEEFGLGYPPRATTLFKRGKTIFSLNWIPFGGFVRMAGEDQIPDQTLTNKHSHYFYAKNSIQRLAVVLAGIIANLAFGILAFSIVFSFIGIPTALTEARIGSVMPDSPAAAAGLPADVTVIAVESNGQMTPIKTWQELTTEVGNRAGQTVTLITTGPCRAGACQEMAQRFDVQVRKLEDKPTDQGLIGVVFKPVEYTFYPWYEMPFRGVVVGFQQAAMLSREVLFTLSGMFARLLLAGQVPAELSGPVGIVAQAQKEGIFKQGPWPVLGFAGILSVNLAIMNLLPIPALDGGRAIFILLEKILGKGKISQVENWSNYGGYIFLLGLIILITARDIWRLFVN